MAQQYFQGTIKTLSDLINQEKQQRFARESPQYQQALFNLMRAKEQAVFQDTLRQQIMSGTISPVDAAVLMGEFAPFTQQLRGQQYQTRAKIEGAEAEKGRTFEASQALREHGYKIAEIQEAAKGRLRVKQQPSASTKYIPVREKILQEIVGRWDKDKQSFGEFYKTLEPKEQEVIDKAYRAGSIFDLLNQTTPESTEELPEL